VYSEDRLNKEGEMTYKQSLREDIRKLEKAKRIRPLDKQEHDALQELYDKLDSHETYFHELPNES